MLFQVLTTVGLTDKPSQLGINLGINFACWIAGVSGALNSEPLGRRTIFVSTVTMLMIFVVITICSVEYVETKSAAADKATMLVICE